VSESPFENIESAHQYVRFLVEAIDESRTQIADDIGTAAASVDLARRLQALRLVDYKLTQLREHIVASSRLLNDLRTLRRLLLGGRADDADVSDDVGEELE
jgi:hypothetical protein